MTYDNFKNYVRDKCSYETIYDDGEGRVILGNSLLDAYTMTHCAPKDWVGLTDEEVSEYFGERWTGYSGYFSCFEEVMKWAEAKLKEKNGG